MSTDPQSFSRRKFFRTIGVGGASLAFGALGYLRYFTPKKYAFKGAIQGANSRVGHLLRAGVQTKPTAIKNINTIIVGGGIAGLSAAWWLKKNNFLDFALLEMDSHVGGNSISGGNQVSKYPWGAHYVPIPGPEAHYVREFFEEVGIIKGYENHLPIYNEYFLCSDPHERLYFQGRWQDGLVPQHGILEEDKRHYSEFFEFVESLKTKKGSDGKFIFSIPLDLSSQDPEFLKLDRISMAAFMASKNWSSKYLNWYVNYCCRDDYGMPHSRVSAWAGLHYFASRSGSAANADNQTVLTWPEGNGFLVSQLMAKVSDKIQKNALVFNITNTAHGNQVDVINTRDNSSVRYLAKNVIFCGPRFVASKIIKGYESQVSLDYAPWVIANITLTQRPSSTGAPLAWDNVSYYSKSLGYIVANHQDLKVNQKAVVFTYYLPLDEKSPKEERELAHNRSYHDWLEIILPDMEKMHPGISKTISNLDIWVWGHGMVSPGIDYLWSEKRKDFLKPFGSIEFAHSDMSGVSIFEESQYRGVEAAKKILKKAKV